MGKKWLPLESNPAVLNEFAAKIGMQQSEYRFCDVFGLDPASVSLEDQIGISRTLNCRFYACTFVWVVRIVRMLRSQAMTSMCIRANVDCLRIAARNHAVVHSSVTAAVPFADGNFFSLPNFILAVA